MMALVVGAAATVGAWVVARWIGRGKPCPVLVAAMFDNRIADRIGGTTTIIARADIRKGMRVLDAGCGPGRLTVPLAREVGPAGEVIALDVQEGMLERVAKNTARAGLRNVQTVRAPLESDSATLSGYRESFDRALLVTVLGEIPDKEGALRALYEVLKPGGILSITEMIIDPDYVGRRKLERLGQSAGFAVDGYFGTALFFTVNLRKV